MLSGQGSAASALLRKGLWGHGGVLLGRWGTWAAVTAGKRRELALNPHFPVVQRDVITPKSLTAASLGAHAPSRLCSSYLCGFMLQVYI